MPRALRHYLDGSFWFVADPCAAEAYLLLPDRPEIAAIIEGVWREGLRRFPVELCSLLVMSNHWHAVLGGPGRDPELDAVREVGGGGGDSRRRRR